jgi:hypothetical protein
MRIVARSLHSLDSLLGSNFKCLGLLIVTVLLLNVLSSLEARCDRGGCVGLPDRSSEITNTLGVLEHSGDFLEWFSGCLWECEEDVDPHCNTEDTENDVGVPSGVDESGWNKEAQREIECPVC